MATKRRLDDPKVREALLELVAAAKTINEACNIVNVDRRAVRRLRDKDPDFAQAFDESYRTGTEVFEAELRRRAIEGVEEPVYQGGALVGHVRKFSDTLLIFSLKRRNPAYRDNHRLELTGADGGALQVESKGVSLEVVLGLLAEANVDPGGQGLLGGGVPGARELLPARTD